MSVFPITIVVWSCGNHKHTTKELAEKCLAGQARPKKADLLGVPVRWTPSELKNLFDMVQGGMSFQDAAKHYYIGKQHLKNIYLNKALKMYDRKKWEEEMEAMGRSYLIRWEKERENIVKNGFLVEKDGCFQERAD